MITQLLTSLNDNSPEKKNIFMCNERSYCIRFNVIHTTLIRFSQICMYA